MDGGVVQFEKAIQTIDFLREYFKSAVLNEVIKPKTFYRVSAGLDYLKNNLTNNYYGITEFSYDVSLSDLVDIIENSKAIEVDKEDISVVVYMDYEEEMFKNVMKVIFEVGIDGISDQLIDNILDSVEKMDKYI